MAAAKRLSSQGSDSGRKTPRDPAEAGAPFDAESVRDALTGAAAERSSSDAPAHHARSLQHRAESVFSGTEAVADQPPQETWSLRRQLVFIVFASAACWALVLAPLLLIF